MPTHRAQTAADQHPDHSENNQWMWVSANEPLITGLKVIYDPILYGMLNCDNKVTLIISLEGFLFFCCWWWKVNKNYDLAQKVIVMDGKGLCWILTTIFEYTMSSPKGAPKELMSLGWSLQHIKDFSTLPHSHIKGKFELMA
jgi:hypothetical protein